MVLVLVLVGSFNEKVWEHTASRIQNTRTAQSAHTIHKPNTAPHKRFFSNETIWAATRKAKNWAFVHHIKTNGYPKWSEDQ